MTGTDNPARTLAGWLPHLACAAVLLAQLAGWALLHRSDEEIRRSWEAGTTRQRLDAFHVMVNRGSPDGERFGEYFVLELLADPDDRIKELAFTNEVCKFAVPTTQTRYIYDFDGKSTAHAWRSFVLHRRKVGTTFLVGSGLRLRLQELEWFLDATRGKPVGEEEIKRHLIKLMERVNQRRQQAEGG